MSEAAKLQFLADVTAIENAFKIIDKLGDSATAAQLKAAGLDSAISKTGKDGAGIKQAIRNLDSLMGKIDPTAAKFQELDEAAEQLKKGLSAGAIGQEAFSDLSNMLDIQRTKVQQQRDELTGYAAEQRAAAAAAVQAAKEQAEAQKAAQLAQQQAAQEAQREAQQIARLTAVLDPSTAATERLRENTELLNRALANGTINQKTYDNLNGKLQDLNDGVKKATISAGQMRFGFANANQQFIDIFTTLSMGMSPLQVLIQQGPQLATSFGTLRNTLTVFLGLINPVTVGVTAVVAGLGYLGYQAYENSKNLTLMSQSLAMAGNQSGVTNKQLVSMAGSLADLYDASSDSAMKAVSAAAAVAGSSKQLQLYANTALAISQQTGEATDTLVQKLSSLGKDPVNALKQLGEQYGFLNPQIVEQVQNLVNAGDSAQAYAVVLNALNGKMAEFTDNQTKSLSEVSSWWDKLIGKSQAYMEWQNKINKQQSSPQSSGSQFIIGESGNSFIRGDGDGLPTQQQQQQQAAKDAAEASLRVTKELQTALPRSVQMYKQILQTQKDIKALNSGGGTEKQIADANKLLSLQQAAYKTQLESEKKKAAGPAPKAIRQDAGTSMVNQYTQENLTLAAQIDALKNRSVYQKNMSEQEIRYEQLKSQFSVLGNQKVLTLQQKQQLAVKDQVLQQAKLLAQKGQELQQLKNQAQIDDDIAKSRDKVTAAIQAANDAAGESTRTRQRELRDLQDIASLRQRGASPSQIAQQLSINNDQDKSDDASRSDYFSGMKSGFKDWADAATDYSKIASNAVSSAMDAGVSAVDDFVLKGKNSFGDFTKSVLSMITQILTKILLLKAIQSGASALGFNLTGLTANAKGGVYDSGSLSRYSNGVYDKPQTFSFQSATKFAKGGVFAEAGPEAIMPLTRDGNGRLGVRSTGGSTGVGNVEVNVNIDRSGNTSSSTSSDNTAGNKFGKALSDAVLGVIGDQMKSGGLLDRNYVSKAG
ncbi:MAG: hypothetical protein [Bacteriophage sp.]|nr:MAG: hypothetical protein [Bacteriophage sp.]